MKERPKIYKEREETEETRRKIMQVAEELFMRYGYRTITTRQVAIECGVTQPALYYHFANKEDLYVAIVLDVLSKIKSELTQITALPNLNAEERLMAMARYLLRFTRHDISTMLNDISQELQKDNRLKVEAAFFESELQPVLEVLEQGIAENRVAPPDVTGWDSVSLAFAFLNLILSSSTDRHDQEQFAPGTASNDQVARRITRLFLHGVAR